MHRASAVQVCISLACNVCVIRSCIIVELYSTAVERLRLGDSHWKHYRHYRHFLGRCKFVLIIDYDYTIIVIIVDLGFVIAQSCHMVL